MTKEKLYKEIVGGMDVSYAHKKALDDFFKSNVYIPKGVNRHPYADVLHALAEGAEIEQKSGRGNWIEVALQNDEYRIKPPEPVYEWQWLEDGRVQNIGFYVEDELEDYPNRVYQKIEETKQIRRSER